MDIKLVSAYDWQGLYINDKLVEENHSLSAKDILNALYHALTFYEIDQSYMEEIGDFPYDFNDINKDYLSEDW